MAFLDEGAGKAYASPHIEETLGFSQAEWLEDPVRWYQQLPGICCSCSGGSALVLLGVGLIMSNRKSGAAWAT